MQKIAGTVEFYPFLQDIVDNWKSRAKKADLKLKDLAVDSGIIPGHLSKIITGITQNPRLDTINSVEMMLKKKEAEAAAKKSEA